MSTGRLALRRSAVRCLVLISMLASLPSEAMASGCVDPDPGDVGQVYECMAGARTSGSRPSGVFATMGVSSCLVVAGMYKDALRRAGNGRSEIGALVPSCSVLAQAVARVRGQPPAWAHCTAYPGRFDGKHIKACLDTFLSEHYGGRGRRVADCNDAIDEYEKALRLSMLPDERPRGSPLPTGYERPTCEEVTTAGVLTPPDRPAIAARDAGQSGQRTSRQRLPIPDATTAEIQTAERPAPPPPQPAATPDAPAVALDVPREPVTVAQGTPPRSPAPQSQPEAVASVRKCDVLAAHADDPEAFAGGVSDARLDAPQAIAACETAIRLDKSPRLTFQLARAYLKADRIEDAIAQLLVAAEQQHGGALAYLGDLVLDGAPGLDADPALARSLYEKAVASGYEPAKKVLSEFEDKTEEFETAEREEASSGPSGKLNPYSYPQVVENIERRQFDNIEYDETWVKSYLYNIADNIRAVCETHVTQNEVNRFREEAKRDLFNIGQAALGATVLGEMTRYAEMLKNPGAFVQEAQANSADNDPFDVALKDTSALFQRHMCRTAGLTQFSKNLKAYVMNEEAPLPAPGAIMNACLRDPLPSKYKPSDFCLCFVGGLAKARVSQANRRDLSIQFNAVAKKLVNIERNRVVFRACQSGY